MVKRSELLNYLNDLLAPEEFSDYCPNGLQVAGKPNLKKIVTGVSANQALIDAALEAKADALLVHHGFFWKGEEPCITSIKRNRLSTLLSNDINLIVYHLPLDAHHEFGNNKQLADVLGIECKGTFSVMPGPDLAWHGVLGESMSAEAFSEHIATVLDRNPLCVEAGAQPIKTVAWCTGAAQDFIEQAAEFGADAYITGEASERTVASARELGIHFFAAGHHATERYGIKSLGEHLAEKFDIACEFIDIDNPV